MTVVRVNVQTPVDGGRSPATGTLRWQPTARRIIPAEGDTPATVILPAGFPVVLVGGSADVDVEPSTGEWVWSVVESFAGAPAKRRYLAVPEVALVDYADLVEVDPETLEPDAEPAPIWDTQLTEVDTRLSAGVITPDPDDPGFFLIGA